MKKNSQDITFYHSWDNFHRDIRLSMEQIETQNRRIRTGIARSTNHRKEDNHHRKHESA